RLFMARDRFGIKPLYYHLDTDRLVFASEVRALVASGAVPDVTDPEALVRFLQFGVVPGPRTTRASVSALPPGHCLTVERPAATPRDYWQLSWSAEPRARETPADAAVVTRAFLDEAVALHLESDAPLGVFLSGGIDSSALVA